MRSFKGIRRYNSSKSLRESLRVPTRPCMYVWTYACFFAAILFIALAGVRQVADKKGGGGTKTTNKITLRLPTRELPEDDTCEGRRVYMYDLPPEYNTVVEQSSRCNHSLIPWMDLCPRFRNKGFGDDLHSSESTIQYPDIKFDYSDWYETDFFMLEVIFHTRMKAYRCLTKHWSTADAFYLPYYTGLLALNYLYAQVGEEIHERPYEERRLFGKELNDWLENNGGEAWRRYSGKDHFVVLGRTTWDFKLRETWSVGFSELTHVANMTSLILESQPGLAGEQAIPYPTVFHPSSPERLQSWLQKVKTARRRYLFSYVGAPREDPSIGSVRGIMTSSCKAAGEDVCNSVDCSVIRCSHAPVPGYNSFLQSKFCLQPRGDTATRRSTFDCLISGAIPVFFHRDTAYTQYSWHLPRDPKSYSVFIDEEDLKRGVSIEEVLRAYSQEAIEDMREKIVSIIPNLLYFDCRKDGCSSMNEMDAFDVTMDRLLKRIAATKETVDFNDSQETRRY